MINQVLAIWVQLLQRLLFGFLEELLDIVIRVFVKTCR